MKRARAGIAAIAAIAGLAFGASTDFPYGTNLQTDAVQPTAGQERSILERLCGAKNLWPGLKSCQVESDGSHSTLSLEARDGVGAYQLSHLLYGSFTAPGASEALANLVFVLGDGGASDSVLLRRVGGVYQPVRVIADLDTSRCLRFRGADGRDRLACHVLEGEGKGGGDPYPEDVRSAFLAVSLSTGGQSVTALFRTPLTNLPSCDNRPPFSAVGPLGWARQDWDHDGWPDLVLEVGRAQAVAPRAYRCTADAATGVRTASPAAVLPAPRATRLVYRFTGAGFTPTPGTVGLARTLGAAR